MTPRKALAFVLDAIGEGMARGAGWFITRALTVNPEAEEPPSPEAVEKILAACFAYRPNQWHKDAAGLAEKTGLPIYFLPTSATPLGKPYYCVVTNPNGTPQVRS